MKTAVLISGQLRTFRKCYPTQRWQIFRHYEPDIHFFASICNDDQAKDIEILRDDYPTSEIEVVDDPDDLPVIPDSAGRFAPYANAASHAKLMLQHWGNKRVWEFFHSKSDPSSFDVIIRIRPDLWIHRFEKPPMPFAHEVFAPWWGKFGGINDRLAIMRPMGAAAYFGTYNVITELLKSGCPFHPETLVAESLRFHGIAPVNRLMIEFSTIRIDGSQRCAEITTSDLAELIASR